MNPAKPFWRDYERLQANGDEAFSAMGSTATALYMSSLKVVGTREQGWTACTGGASGLNRDGINGTAVVATFSSDSSANLTTGVLALATYVYEARKTIVALQNLLEYHGLAGTTIS